MVTCASDPGSRSSSTWTGSGPTSRSPTTCVDCGKTACAIVAKLEPHCCGPLPCWPAPTRSTPQPARLAPPARLRSDPPAHSGQQRPVPGRNLSAAPQSRAWTADNTGLLQLQRSRSYCVAAVSDICLDCLAPRKSDAGKWPPRITLSERCARRSSQAARRMRRSDRISARRIGRRCLPDLPMSVSSDFRYGSGLVVGEWPTVTAVGGRTACDL